MSSWANKEAELAKLGDLRLKKRLIGMLESLASTPSQTIPATFKIKPAIKAAYRFFDSERIMPQAILQAHIQQTCARAAQEATVFVIQDTTSLDFTTHDNTSGLGNLDATTRRGLMVHSALCTDFQGVPLGLVSQQVWTRDPALIGKRPSNAKRKMTDKESHRWIEALSQTEACLPESVRVITIADRESDYFDFLAASNRPNSYLLIRAHYNRCIEEESKYLERALAEAIPSGTVEVDVHRADGRPARKATLTLRHTEVTLKPPLSHFQPKERASLKIRAILAEEEKPPSGAHPLKWLILTTLPISSHEDAVQYLSWYSKRWLIERYHFVLKSGCRIEDLQLETAQRLRRALEVYSIVAWRLLWITLETRKTPEAPCTKILRDSEWKALYVRVHKKKPPKTPPSLRDAVRWIAMLGGFLGRKQDGEPGVKTIWQGLILLQECAEMWDALHS